MDHEMTNSIDSDKKIEFITLSTAGEGGIEAGLDQQERLDEFTEKVGSGEFHTEASTFIPCGCIDGRCGCQLRANSAGGSETLMVADDLTTKDFALDGDNTTAGQQKRLLTFLKETGYPVGGHTAEDLHGAPSGCGANDKLPAIYEYISRNGDGVRAIAESLGYEISNDDHELITGNANARSEFSNGKELLDILEEIGGQDSVDVLKKGHKEVVAVINKRFGTTLDRDAVNAEFGDSYQAFNVDEWSFEEGARVTSHKGGDAEVRVKRIAMMYYNLATAGVLCGPNMRVTVLN